MSSQQIRGERRRAIGANLRWNAARLRGKRPVPFILLSNRRCGNNMLRSALNRHPDVLLDTEVFMFAHLVREKKPVPEEMLELIRRDPARATVELFLQGQEKGKMASGFTLFDWHMRGDEREQLWRFLDGFPNLRILDLRRKNRLLQWISLKEAEVSRQWAVYPWQKYTEYPPIELFVDDFLQWLDETDQLHQQSLSSMGRAKRIELYYENFEDDYRCELSRVLRFLGVSELHLEAETERLNKRTLRERIANYDAFVESLKGTRGERYFEDARERKPV